MARRITGRRDPHRLCRHRGYQLSCEEFDEIAARAGNCCEICRRPAALEYHKVLYIDHDHEFGPWAVRGLLCLRCNVSVDATWSRLDRAVVGAYMAGAWYIGRLREAGLPADPPLRRPSLFWVDGRYVSQMVPAWSTDNRRPWVVESGKVRPRLSPRAA